MHNGIITSRLHCKVLYHRWSRSRISRVCT